jgi:hypothetical protein
VKTRALFERLEFGEDWEAMTDQSPAYYYDFGNLRLTATQVMSYFGPRFLLGGQRQAARSITIVDSRCHWRSSHSWRGFGLGEGFRPLVPTPWLGDGRTWQDRLLTAHQND